MTRDLEKLQQEYADLEQRWEYVCEQKGFKCDRCGEPPLYSEKEGFFLHGYCGYCLNAWQKIEDE